MLRSNEVDVEEAALKKIILVTAAFFIFFLVLGLVGQVFAQSKIEGANVRYTAGGVEMIGYLAYDAAIQSPRPAVLVVHEWWGLNDYARMRAHMLANSAIRPWPWICMEGIRWPPILKMPKNFHRP